MKIISKKFLLGYGKKIINIHPSLLPKFKGLNTYEKVLKSEEIKTGCTVHFVNDKLDDGKIVAQKSFFIEKNDTEETLKKKRRFCYQKVEVPEILFLFNQKIFALKFIQEKLANPRKTHYEIII